MNQEEKPAYSRASQSPEPNSPSQEQVSENQTQVSENQEQDPSNTKQEENNCMECNRVLGEEDEWIDTEKGSFCEECYTSLKAELEHIIEHQGDGINLLHAAFGGIFGASFGVLAWWGITTITGYSIGLIAILISFASGKGILFMTKNQRSKNLQYLSVGISSVAYFYAEYLVQRSFPQNANLPLVPSFEIFFGYITHSFNVYTAIFLAIIVWQAWVIPAPYRIVENR